MAGLTATGFTRKQLPQVVTSLQDRFIAVLTPLQPVGEPVDVAPQSLIGQTIGVVSQDIADLWEALEDLYNNQYPDSAFGVCLEQACLLVGVGKLGTSSSTTTLSITGDEGAAIPSGFQARNTAGIYQVNGVGAVTIGAADRVQVNVPSAGIGDDFTITINGTPYTVTAVSPTAASVAALLVTAVNGAIGTASAVATDSDPTGATLDVYATGSPISVAVSGNLDVTEIASQAPATAVTTGPIDASANTIQTIVTPAAGLLAVTNRFDGVQGVDIETEPALKQRRRSAVRGPGSASAAAVRARLPNMVPGIQQINIYENNTDVVDGDGRPAGAFEVVVVGGDDQAIANALWAMKPMGNGFFGNVSKTVLDAAGGAQTVSFSRPTQIYLWVLAAITDFDENVAYPVDGDQQIANAIATQGNLIKAGGLVVPDAFKRAIYGIPGIAAVTVTIATSATAAGPPGAYSGANLQLTATQQGKFDPARVGVTP